MNELDVVRVKNTARAEEMFHGGETEIEANWEGTIVADADTSTPWWNLRGTGTHRFW
jgi:hypothetical protein